MDYFGLIDTSSRTKVPLESIRIQANIQGYAAQVVATIEYKNDQSNPIEAIYVFPLDEEAAVCGFQATIDGRTVVAEVQEKQEARDTYDDAISSGHSAFLLEESDESSDIFQINVGNLPPQKAATVELTFITELAVEKEGRVRFVLPTVLNPRYTPEGTQASASSSFPRLASVGTKYSFDFELQVQCSSEIQEITSPHSKLKIVMNAEDNHRATVTLDEEYKFDVDVEIQVLGRDAFTPRALTEDGVTKKDGVTKTKDDKPDDFLAKPVVTLNFLPDFKDAESLETGEFIFVVDRSGSMSGGKIKNARETLLLFLKSLPNGCHFNVVGFGSTFQKLFSSSQTYNDSNLKEACKSAETLNADLGGTEILSPLQDVFSQPLVKGCPRQVFLLTDGEVGNTEQVISEVRRNAHKARCFAFGIGQGASTALVKGVARAGKGSAEFITSDDRMQAKVIRTLRNALQPVLEDVKVVWELPKGWGAENVPSVLPPIFNGNRLVLYGLLNKDKGGLLSGEVEGKATLYASINDKSNQSTPIKHQVQFRVVAGSDVGEGSSLLLHRLAAKRSIQEIQDAKESYEWFDEQKSRVISISKSANVVSKVTSFVAVDKESHVPIAGPMGIPSRYDEMSQFSLRGGCLSAPMGSYNVQSTKMRKKKGFGFSFSSLTSNLFGSSGGKRKGVRKGVVEKSRSAGPRARAPMMMMAQSHGYSDDSTPPIKHCFDKYEDCYDDVCEIPTCSAPRMDRFEGRDRSPDDRSEDAPKLHPPKYAQPKQGLLELIALQTASGAWQLTEELAAVFSKPMSELKSACPAGLDSTMWGTALALAWLHGKFASKQDEWEMVGEKGSNLLKKKLETTSSSYDKVMETAASALGVTAPEI